MRYENPTPREDVNYSKEHPLKEFAQLLVGVSILVTLAIIALNSGAGYLAKRIPFSFEQTMADKFDFFETGPTPQQVRLQSIADQLIPLMNLPAGMQIKVHYSADETVNAFATLGGHVLFFQGLLDEIENDQALAAVMAHEIAHVKHRHPVVALGKGFTLASLAGFVGGASGSSTGEWLIGSSASVSLLRFSRAQESAADLTAAHALYALYGDIGGAKQLFDTFAKLQSEHLDTSAGIDLFRSHPHPQDRWERLAHYAKQKNWLSNDELTP